MLLEHIVLLFDLPTLVQESLLVLQHLALLLDNGHDVRERGRIKPAVTSLRGHTLPLLQLVLKPRLQRIPVRMALLEATVGGCRVASLSAQLPQCSSGRRGRGAQARCRDSRG